MIERGSGQTSGLTNWNSMDVISMWSCIEGHDTNGHWQQVAGWRKVCDLAQTHLGRLQEYRRGLAEAWPPETNAAARAYIGELDQLIDQVQRTHDAATANYDALAAATRAISSTRDEMKPLFDAYAAKLQQKLAYEQTVADPKAAAGSRQTGPLVTDAVLERINEQARSVMLGLSGELQQAQVTLRQPPPKPWSPIQHDNPDVYGTTSAAPIIPPIVAVPLVPSSGTSAISRATKAARPLPTPTAPNPGPVLGAGPTSGPGPVLGSAGTGLAPTPANPGLPGLTPTTPATPSPSTGLGMAPNLPLASGSTGRGPHSGPARGQQGPLGRPITGRNGALPHVTQPRAMPPGGLIGGVPGIGLGQPSAGATPPRRVNPVGGVIGGGGAGTAPSGAAGSRPGAGRAAQFGGMQGMVPMGGAPGIGGTAHGRSDGPHGMGGSGQGVGATSGRRNPDEGEPRRWDPDHPWEIDEGVTPVVRPPDDQGPIDPGPAIGFDR
ncbi:hypothetical protein [Micromonospora sp. DT47]|uniref:hypothetical protein n=1 Tax=Micromonospora sp. DT47 TaxID=3393431 RepID=UPI003CEF3E2A